MIKIDMEMPESCSGCKMLQAYYSCKSGWILACRITLTNCDKNFKRLKNCPLIEVTE